MARVEVPVIQGIKDVPAISFNEAYNNIRLMDRILYENRTSLKLSDLRVKAQAKAEETWQLKDGLLFRYSKLYVTNRFITLKMPF
jgi:hypothetical protein